jgi:hypothetical protein
MIVDPGVLEFPCVTTVDGVENNPGIACHPSGKRINKVNAEEVGALRKWVLPVVIMLAEKQC